MRNWRIPPEPVPREQIVKVHDTEVVVVGLGYAGTAAFRAAAEAGVKAIGIENQQEAKYQSWGRDVGHLNSEFLASRGIPKADELEYFNEWMRRACGRANPGLIMRFVKNEIGRAHV